MPLDPSQYANLFASQQRQPYTLVGDMEGGTPYPTVPETIAARSSVSYEPPPAAPTTMAQPPRGTQDNGMAYFAALAQLGASVAQVLAAQRKKPARPPGVLIEGTPSPQQIEIPTEDYHRYLPGG